MKKIFLLVLVLLISGQLVSFGINIRPPEIPETFIEMAKPEQDLTPDQIENVYNNLIPSDVEFENNLDPYEQQDNYSYGRSPYPLIRTVMDMHCKKVTVPPGYYLLTPRKINGRDYMLFKQEGRVLFIIPVFENVQIDVDREYPQPEDPYEKVPFGLRSVWKLFGIISGRRTPIVKVPQHKVDCFAYDNRFYGINVYYKDRMYKTIYKVKLDE